MRKIKFRAWNIDHKRMEYISDLYWFEENGVLDDSGMGSSSDYILEQFTGCYDENGKEIYEGDIIDGWGEVIYQGAAFCISGEPMFSLKTWKLAVIGNIHENAELLK